MSYYCFTKDCEFYEKPAPTEERGRLLLGCSCCNGGPYIPTYCAGCGGLRVEHDNYSGSDERSEKEKFAGTRQDWREVVESNYLQSKYTR